MAYKRASVSVNGRLLIICSPRAVARGIDTDLRIHSGRAAGSGVVTGSPVRALLEFYFRCDSDVRSWIGPLGLIGAKEIKIPFDCNPCARNQFEVFNAGITYLHSRAVLTVLNNGVVQIQFVLSV